MQPSRSSAIPKVSVEQMFRFGLSLGSIMIALGYIWVELIRGDEAFHAWFSDDWQTIVLDVIIGLGVGGFVALAFTFLGEHIKGFQNIRDLLVARIDFSSFRWSDCLWLALLAAIPEEILFRGAMQPTLGLLLTALIFGVLHGITRLYLIYAIGAGLLLGILYEYHETLWLPIATHFAVDYFSLIWLSNWARQQIPPPDPLQDLQAIGIADRGDDLESL